MEKFPIFEHDLEDTQITQSLPTADDVHTAHLEKLLANALEGLREAAVVLERDICALRDADWVLSDLLGDPSTRRGGPGRVVQQREEETEKVIQVASCTGTIAVSRRRCSEAGFWPRGRVPSGYRRRFFTRTLNQDGRLLKHPREPERNEDVARIGSIARGPLRWWYRQALWRRGAIATLRQAVVQQARERRVADICWPSSGENVDLSFEEVEEKLEAIRNATDEDLAQDAVDWTLFDWEELRKRNAHVLHGHGPESCRNRFLNWDSPALESYGGDVWLPDTDRILLRLALAHDGMEWSEIAEELEKETGEKRSPFQCFVRYRSKLDDDVVTRGKWERDEDEMLIDLVNELGKSWSTISKRMQWRTPDQCLHRYEKVLRPNRRSGKWTVEEVKMLREAVEELGCRWSLVAGRIPGRTDVQCREKWVRNIGRNRNKWTAEEDSLLVQLVCDSPNPKWSEISRELKTGRTDTSCRKRFRVLEKDLSEEQQRRLKSHRSELTLPEPYS